MDYLFLGIMGFSILLMVGLGIAVKYYRAYWLIAGYNTMSKADQAQVDVESLGNFTGNTTFIMAGLMAIATVLIMMGYEIGGMIAFGTMIPLSIYMVVKSQQYNKNTRRADGTMTKKGKILVWSFVGLMVATFVGVGVLIYYSALPPQFTFAQDHLAISGMYGEKIPYQQIEELILAEELPKILARNNGASLGTTKKGYFKLEGINRAKLLLDTSRPPFIFLTKEGKKIIFNGDRREDTEKLFHQLKIHIN